MDKESNSLGYLYEVIGEVFGDKLDIIKQAGAFHHRRQGFKNLFIKT